MYPNNNTIPRIIEAINKANTGVIILPLNPSIDAIAAASSLYLSLIKTGKIMSLVCASPIKSNLIGADKAQNTLSATGDNLVISFPYSDGMIDKVDYNIQGNSFNLIIAPRQGCPKLNPNQVKYSYSGGVFDFIITIDAPNLNSLGPVYSDNQSQFQGKSIINIDRHLTNGFYGTVNFVNTTSSSTSELVFKIIQALNIEPDKDIATNLYAGISTATNNFTSYSINAETFETVAQLLKMGAVKKPPTKVSFQSQQPLIGSFEQQINKPIQSVEKPVQSKEGPATPQDWLKPKIFKGGGLI